MNQQQKRIILDKDVVFYFFEFVSIIVIIFTWMIDFFQQKKLSGFFSTWEYNNAKFSSKGEHMNDTWAN